MESGLVSHAFIKILSGLSLIFGVLLKGLVLNELNKPDSISRFNGS